jgi:Rps23 Pro-64 3,4-dihydroxylase Tpa1-like proline 4-hydroxylase
MTSIEAKEKLKKNGYTWFELSEFDPEFYNWLQPLKCNEEINLKDKITTLRMDMSKHPLINNPQVKDNFETHELASQRKNEIINDYKNITNFSQIWYYSDLNEFLEISKLKESDYKKYVQNIVSYFFDFEKDKKYSDLSCCTYYDTGCHLQNHSDGTGTGRICALLIYLNEDYDAQDGGCLILDTKQIIVPKFGRVAIIDLQTFDIPHMVTEVTGGIGRYALLSFVKAKENESIHSSYEMKPLI